MPRRKFDPRWLFVVATLIIIAIVAVIVNINHANHATNKIAGTIDVDNGDLKIDWGRYQTFDITLSNTLTITKSGTYHLAGSLNDQLIIVDAGVSEVRLLLDNVSIVNSTGPAIACYSAEDLVIELVGENNLSSGATYDNTYDEDVTGAIYSKADLIFQGEGSLNLVTDYQDAIVGKDDVKFNSGTYNITAVDDAIRGKDSVYIVAGNFALSAGADAIKSTNEFDVGKGFILIENGNFDIAATGKGIKSVDNILLYGGNYAIVTKDDAVHSNNYVGIANGTININSGDDGVHADRELIIDGGDITIAKAYEGAEAQVVTINGGNLSLTTSDDGINAGGGADASAANRTGAGAFNADESCVISINGGNIYVNAGGDGIDSNGYLNFSGGKVVVDGPSNNGNGALDAGVAIVMNGGEVLAIGSSGMAESLGNSSSVYNVSIFLNSTQPAGTIITFKDQSGNVIASHTAAKSFGHIAIGLPSFQLGATYTLYLNDNKYQDFTISNITTTIGNSPNQMTPPSQNTNKQTTNQRR